MHPLSTYTNGKEILKFETTIWSSVHCQLLGRYFQDSLNRLCEYRDQTGLLPESQCRFKKDRAAMEE